MNVGSLTHYHTISPQTTGDVTEQYHAHLFMSRHHIRQGHYKEAEVHAHQACQFDAVRNKCLLYTPKMCELSVWCIKFHKLMDDPFITFMVFDCGFGYRLIWSAPPIPVIICSHFDISIMHVCVRVYSSWHVTWARRPFLFQLHVCLKLMSF